jgi:hypothetical protein
MAIAFLSAERSKDPNRQVMIFECLFLFFLVLEMLCLVDTVGV